MDFGSRIRSLGGALLAALLMVSGSALPAAAVEAAQKSSPPARQTAIGTFPPGALSCVRKYLKPSVLQQLTEVGPTAHPDKLLAAFDLHFDHVNRVADMCGFAATEQGGQQIAHLIMAVVAKDWSEDRLRVEFAISPDQLSAIMSGISRADLAKIAAIPDGPYRPESVKEALPPVLDRASAALGLKGERAYLLLSLYIRSTAQMPYFE